MRRELLKMGMELDDGRERLIDACELGAERPFRDLVMAFAEPPRVPRPSLNLCLRSSQCSAPPTHRQRLQPRDGSCSKTVEAVGRRCEMNNGDILTWKDAPNPELRPWRRAEEFPTNSARSCAGSTPSMLLQRWEQTPPLQTSSLPDEMSC